LIYKILFAEKWWLTQITAQKAAKNYHYVGFKTTQKSPKIMIITLTPATRWSLFVKRAFALNRFHFIAPFRQVTMRFFHQKYINYTYLV
jgi:hypothetical protein